VVVFVVIFASVLAPSSLFAENTTRAHVYQELTDAKPYGLNYVTDTSHLEVHPSFAPQGARSKPHATAPGTDNH
jgi:hypothetical protein